MTYCTDSWKADSHSFAKAKIIGFLDKPFAKWSRFYFEMVEIRKGGIKTIKFMEGEWNLTANLLVKYN